MANRSKDKGSRFEREAVAILTAAGLDAKRIPLSGAMRGYKGDVALVIGGQNLRLECKVRKSGFKFIYDAMSDNDALLVKTDRAEPLVVIGLQRLARLLGKEFGGKPSPTPIAQTPTQQAPNLLSKELAKYLYSTDWFNDLVC